jgi:hypothetical protein
MMKFILSFTALLSLTMTSGCGVGERDITVENCGEPVEISDCKWKGQLFSCLIMNNSAEIYRGISIWKYDADNQPLENAPFRYAVGLKPGDQSREKLPVTKYGKDTTVKVIFCNRRPE